MGLGGVGAGGYLGEKAGYGGTVYPGQYGCYYTNMDYLSPAGMAAHSSVVPVSIQHSQSGKSRPARRPPALVCYRSYLRSDKYRLTGSAAVIETSRNEISLTSVLSQSNSSNYGGNSQHSQSSSL